MRKMNKFLPIISLMLSFYSSSIFAMETDAMEIDEPKEMEVETETKNFTTYKMLLEYLAQ